MSSVRLGPTSYVVLGMLALRGPSTPYQLRRAVERTIGHFWSFPRSQFYDEPARLAGEGLLDEEREEGGRRRLTYTITARGRQALRTWLGEPSGQPMEIRDVGELKLFFGELGPREDVVAAAREQERLNRDRLRVFEAIEKTVAERGDLPATRTLPLELGLRLMRVTVDFWAEAADRLAAGPDERPQ